MILIRPQVIGKYCGYLRFQWSDKVTRKEVSLVLGGLGSLEWPKSEQKEEEKKRKKEGVLFCLSLILLIL